MAEREPTMTTKAWWEQRQFWCIAHDGPAKSYRTRCFRADEPVAEWTGPYGYPGATFTTCWVVDLSEARP